MTSKSLFFKLLKEDFKVRIWTLAVSILIFFFSHIVGTAMMLSMYKYNRAFSEPTDLLSYKVEFVQTFYSYIGIKNPLFAFIFVVLAVIVAMSGFSYLYSKKKVDMYHSLPVRREVLFFVKILNGILIVILPYIVCSFIASLLVLVNMGDAGIIVTTFFSVAEWILLFIFNYTIVIFAIMLTGNMLIGILACGFLNFYAPAFSQLISGYESTFFDTYYEVGFIAEKVLLKLSGIMVIFGVFDGRLREKMLIAVVGSIVLLVINLLLYKKRASESAGKSISFNIIKLPIKFMIVIFMSMLMYLFGYEMMSNSIAWGVFGAVSAGIITHCIMEIIYNQDFKKIFAKKLQMLICIVISLFVAAVFQFDIFGYDRYIPKVSDISSAAVVSDFLESNASQYFNEMGFHNETRYDSITNIEYASDNDIESMLMREMNIKDKEAVVALAKLGVANLSSEWRADSISERVLISYKLKSGKKVQRVYNIDFDAAIKELSSIYDDEGYKTGMYPILSEDSKNIVSVDFNGIKDNDKHLTSENGDLAKLTEVYKKELMSLKGIGEATAEAIIEHRKENKFTFPSLAGVGTIFMVVLCLFERAGEKEKAYEYIDLVAIGTVADIVPLLEENRILTKFGLEKLLRSKNKGLNYLLYKLFFSGNKDQKESKTEYTTYDVGFIIAPVFNAAGRLKDAKMVVKLLISDNSRE
ncbi:MAG: hypothetical protein KH170_04845, partial [Lachnospiraceae bacterium oral taxon 082]|nr:hypothetical protein [Lachnospiraceae bacterium oral taxon 082]